MDIDTHAPKTFLDHSNHPVILAIHIGIKCLGIVIYMFGSWIFSFVFSCILVILIVCMDFWIVKNISGRLLAGLRWHHDSTSNTWIYESSQRNINHTDRFCFWATLYINLAIWTLFCLFSFLRFNILWIPVIFTALATTTANIVGYTHCDKDAKQTLLKRVDNPLLRQVFASPEPEIHPSPN